MASQQTNALLILGALCVGSVAPGLLMAATPASAQVQLPPECVVRDHPLDRAIAERIEELGDTLWDEDHGVCDCGQPCWKSVYNRQQADACYDEVVKLADELADGLVIIDPIPVSYLRLSPDDTTPRFAYRVAASPALSSGHSSWSEAACWYDTAAGETWYAELIGPGGTLTWPDSYWESEAAREPLSIPLHNMQSVASSR